MNRQRGHTGLRAQTIALVLVWSGIRANSAQPRFTLAENGVSQPPVVRTKPNR